MSRRKQTRAMAEHVLGESTRAAIEKIAEEFARDVLADPEFRQRLREQATRAARAAAASLRRDRVANP